MMTSCFRCYVPDYNDYPCDDVGSDWEDEPAYCYFDVDMYGQVADFDVPTGCYVKALDSLSARGWNTIHSK